MPKEDNGPPTIPPGGPDDVRTPEDMRSSYPRGVPKLDLKAAETSMETRLRSIVRDENDAQSKNLRPVFVGIFGALGVLAGITVWSAVDMRQRVDVLRTDVEARIEALEKRVTELENK